MLESEGSIFRRHKEASRLKPTLLPEPCLPGYFEVGTPQQATAWSEKHSFLKQETASKKGPVRQAAGRRTPGA